MSYRATFSVIFHIYILQFTPKDLCWHISLNYYIALMCEKTKYCYTVTSFSHIKAEVEVPFTLADRAVSLLQ